MRILSRDINSIFLLIILLIATYSNIDMISANTIEPMRDLRPGWEATTIYEIPHPPGPKCIGANGDLFYLDNLNNIAMKMDEFGIHTVYQTLDSSYTFSALCYQPISNRLIGLSDYGFYIITSSDVIWLNNFTTGDTINTVTVDPSDDSFFCSSLFSESNITHYDANGNYISTILTDIQGCSQLVLNNNQSILYYTETYSGSFSSLNLTSMEIEILRTDIGLPGTQEVIGIGVDDNDDLYEMTADGNNRGFFKYQNGSFVLLMASKGGMSSLTWSSKLQQFIAAGSAGGCLIGYDPLKSEAKYLTPIINSGTIIETHEGIILYAFDDEIYELNESGPSLFSKNPDGMKINNLILDVDNSIFALLANDSVSINRVTHDGTFEVWFHDEITDYAKSILYDALHHEFILLAENIDKNESYVYRIPIANPLSYSKITTFSNTTKIKAAIDMIGNIYIYEAYNNTLYKIPNDTYVKEIVTTDFADFSDIYGPNFVVEPPLVYCTIENGIIYGRNDDLHLWLLDQNVRVTLGINNRGIDNSAMYENTNQEILVTQSTLIMRLKYQEPTIVPEINKEQTSFYIAISLITFMSMCFFIRRKFK